MYPPKIANLIIIVILESFKYKSIVSLPNFFVLTMPKMNENDMFLRSILKYN